MATSSMHNLTTLIKRLEAATSRLEDMATTSGGYEQGPGDSASELSNEAAIAAGGVNGASAGGAVPGDSSRKIGMASSSRAAASTGTKLKTMSLASEVEDYDTLINGDVATFCDASSTLDPVLRDQAKALHDTFEAQRQFILLTTKAKKPEMGGPDFMEIIKDTQEGMGTIEDIKQRNRASPMFDHIAMVADGAQTFGWVVVDSKPADYVAELFGGAQIYGNKVLKQYKDKDETHVEWVKSYYKLIRSLISYVKQHHPKGIQWNPDGVSALEALHQIKSESSGAKIASAAPSGSGAPPPPPLPPPGQLTAPPPPPPPPPPAGGAPSTSTSKAAPDMGAVFNQLNMGEDITSGLKKVDPSQMTHKNPALRSDAALASAESIGRSKAPTPPGKKPKPESMRAKKPPRQELDGNKWIIENFDSPSAPLEIKAEIQHSILITKCKATTIRIIGKANAISIDSSVKTSIIVDSLVSSVDVIKCPTFALQILETVPTVLLDQVDGATVYLSKDSLKTEIFTSKCSAINIYLPPTSQVEDEDYKEVAIPEQLRSFVRDGKLVTEIVEHMG